MNLQQAEGIAIDLVEQMRPYCHRIEIAGSIRRRSAEVKDIEIVAVPKWETATDPGDLFGERSVAVNQLHEAFKGRLRWIKPGTQEIISWPVQPDGKYWRAYLAGVEPRGIKLDLFLATPENWGLIFLIRTGSADFSREVVTYAKYHGKPVVDGRLTMSGVPVETPEEADVFRLLGLRFVEPQQRRDKHDLHEVPR